MNYTKAIHILELHETHPIEFKDVKKQYYKLALKYHPDKNINNKVKTEEIFKEILESYEFLQNYYNNTILPEDSPVENKNYLYILKKFLFSFMPDTLNKEEQDEVVKNIISGVYNNIFNYINKEKLLHIYEFLYIYKTILCIDETLLENILEIIKSKYFIYILNPSIEDLLNDRVFKLCIDTNSYYVPLWGNEVIFEDQNNNEIIVKCIPEEMDNIILDVDNNMIVHYEIEFGKHLLDLDYITVYICNKEYKISTNELMVVKNQEYIINNQGVLKKENIDISDMDLKNRSDIILKLVFI